MRFKMSFSIIINSCHVTELGAIEETVWSLTPSLALWSLGSFGRRRCVSIIRSRGNGAVKIDVCVNNMRGSNLISRNGFLLSDGETNAKFVLNVTDGTIIAGHVTVHYNLALPSKKEVVTKTENVISSIAEKTIPSTQLVNDLLQLLNNPDSFSDSTLVCGTSKLPVHRNILSARSPVFAAMFKTKMQEGCEGVVHIVDMEPDVLQAMLRYVYSGKTDHLTCSMAGDLVFAADKYQLEELKSFCVVKLKVNMAEDNVFRSLVLGDLHDKNLKAHAVDFICKCKHFSDLENSDEWKSLLDEHSHLAVEVLTTVVKYLRKKLYCSKNDSSMD